MKKLFLSATLALATSLSVYAASEAKDLVDLSVVDAGSLKTENEATVEAANEGGTKALKFTFPESKGYPGVNFDAPDGVWNLSDYGAVSVDIINNGGTQVGVSMRVENKGDWHASPWDANVIWLKPGATGTLKVTFGESFGKPGFALDPANVSRVKIFINNPKDAGDLTLQNLQAVAK